MKRAIIISAISLFILLAVSFTYVKFNPPLVVGTLASGNEKHIAIVGVGNKGFKHIKISDVLVNNEDEPQEVMVQVSNPLKGFIVTDPFDPNAKEFGIENVESVSIQPKTSPEVNWEKMDEGTATEKDIIYGITIVQDRPIDKVMIKYDYLGLSFVKKVIVP